MKLQMIKQPGGILSPSHDRELDYLNKLKNGGQYEIEIKKTRNPDYHRRAFAFFNFCFEHWASDKTFLDEKGQFDWFRNDMTIQAGFYDVRLNLDGSTTLKARSLSFARMEQLEFEQCYNALIQVALRQIFTANDNAVFEKLLKFFD